MHDFSNRSENVVFVDTEFAGFLKGVGEQVEEELRVGGSVDMSVGVVVEVVSKMFGVGQVTVLLAKPSESKSVSS